MIDIPTGTFKVERFEPGAYGDDGNFVRGAKSEFNIEASIQPMTGNETKLLPEHKRNAEAITIFSEERLFPSDDKNNKPADIVIFDDRKFEIFKVMPWSEITDIPHYESIAIMEDGQGGGA